MHLPGQEISAANILIAEDDPDDVFFLRRVLAKVEKVTKIQHVDDGQKAINYLAGAGEYADRAIYPLPEILFLDLKLPAFTGHEVLDWIRTQPRLSAIRVYILTSSDEETDRMRVRKAGAAGYFIKPLSGGRVSEIFPSL